MEILRVWTPRGNHGGGRRCARAPALWLWLWLLSSSAHAERRQWVAPQATLAATASAAEGTAYDLDAPVEQRAGRGRAEPTPRGLAVFEPDTSLEVPPLPPVSLRAAGVEAAVPAAFAEASSDAPADSAGQCSCYRPEVLLLNSNSATMARSSKVVEDLLKLPSVQGSRATSADGTSERCTLAVEHVGGNSVKALKRVASNCSLGQFAPGAEPRVVVLGGDGTVSAALAFLRQAKSMPRESPAGPPLAPVVHFPGGNGNDFARTAGWGGSVGEKAKQWREAAEIETADWFPREQRKELQESKASDLQWELAARLALLRLGNASEVDQWEIEIYPRRTPSPKQLNCFERAFFEVEDSTDATFKVPLANTGDSVKTVELKTFSKKILRQRFQNYFDIGYEAAVAARVEAKRQENIREADAENREAKPIGDFDYIQQGLSQYTARIRNKGLLQPEIGMRVFFGGSKDRERAHELAPVPGWTKNNWGNGHMWTSGVGALGFMNIVSKAKGKDVFRYDEQGNAMGRKEPRNMNKFNRNANDGLLETYVHSGGTGFVSSFFAQGVAVQSSEPAYVLEIPQLSEKEVADEEKDESVNQTQPGAHPAIERLWANEPDMWKHYKNDACAGLPLEHDGEAWPLPFPAIVVVRLSQQFRTVVAPKESPGWADKPGNYHRLRNFWKKSVATAETPDWARPVVVSEPVEARGMSAHRTASVH